MELVSAAISDKTYGNDKSSGGGSTPTGATAAVPGPIHGDQSAPAASRLYLRRNPVRAMDAVRQAQLRLCPRPRQPARPLFSALLEGKRQNRLATLTRRARRALPSVDSQPSATPVHHPTDARRLAQGPPFPPPGQKVDKNDTENRGYRVFPPITRHFATIFRAATLTIALFFRAFLVAKK